MKTDNTTPTEPEPEFDYSTGTTEGDLRFLCRTVNYLRNRADLIDKRLDTIEENIIRILHMLETLTGKRGK